MRWLLGFAVVAATLTVVVGAAARSGAVSPSVHVLPRVGVKGAAAPLRGSLDPGFGVDGQVTARVGPFGDFFGGPVVVEPDGKIVMAGESQTNKKGTTADFALVRFNADGALDNGFGAGGKVTTAVGAVSYAKALVIQADGKVVAAGLTANADGSNHRIAVVRYNPNGSLDTSFGNNGKVITEVGRNSAASALVVQPDGRLVVAGTGGKVLDGPGSTFVLLRYNANGSLDKTFGTGGKVTTSFGPDAWADALVLQPDGKLVAAGTLRNGSSDSFALARYNANGSLDKGPLIYTGFGPAGLVTTAVGAESNVSALLVEPDGTLVAAGTSSAQAGRKRVVALVKYDANGRLDTQFGVGGRVTTAVGETALADAVAIVRQPDGHLVALSSGPGAKNGSSPFVLIRYNANGSRDTGFGNGGMVATTFGTYSLIASALVRQPDGKFVAAGWGSEGYGSHIVNAFALMRLNP